MTDWTKADLTALSQGHADITKSETRVLAAALLREQEEHAHQQIGWMEQLADAQRSLREIVAERDALGVQNHALREALRDVLNRNCDPDSDWWQSANAQTQLDPLCAAAIAAAATRVCEAVEKVMQMTHSNSEWERKSLDGLKAALVEWRKAKEGK